MRSETVKRILLFVGGAVVLGYMVYRAGAGNVGSYLSNLGIGLALPIGFVGVQHCLRNLSWHAAVGATGHPLPYSYLLRARLGAECLGYLSLTGALGSQTSKVWLLREGVPMRTGAASVIVDALASVIAGILFSGAALLVTQWALELPAWVSAIGGALVGLGATAWILATVWTGKRRKKRPEANEILMLPAPRTTLRAAGRDALRRMGAALVRLRGLPFARMIFLHSLGHVGLVSATYSILAVLGISTDVFVGLFFELGAKLGNVVGAFIPARLGVFEAGVAASSDLIGLGAAAGLAVALVRRLVDLIWVGTGLVILVFGMPKAGPMLEVEQELVDADSVGTEDS